jgi:uncharacterized membrane protein
VNATTGIQSPSKTVPAPPLPGSAEATPVDSHWRSVVKAISWRAVGTVDTMVISYLVTGKVKLAVSIGCVELFTKIALFYTHERVWHKIPYGRAK